MDKQVMEFKSKHNLPFEACDWPRNPSIKLFRIGTCNGQWLATDLCYVIISIMNETPGNGHLDDVFEWFENSCRRNQKDLLIMEFFNPKFKKHCIEKRGFTEVKGTDDLIKHFK